MSSADETRELSRAAISPEGFAYIDRAEDFPRCALRRFLNTVATLPKTPSERVAKALLREVGLSAHAQDLEPVRTSRLIHG